MKPAPFHLIAALLLVAAWPHAGRGEVFVLASGGRVEGELLNPDESPRQSYVVKTQAGVEITLSAD
ncbi:MAG: hypothetical protein ABIK89_20990 [Planctomycetota bacterium]